MTWGNAWGNSWGNAWGFISNVVAPSREPSRGGIDPRYYTEYRAQLEELARIASERNRENYIKQAVKVAKLAQEKPLDEKVEARIAETVQIATPDIDFSFIEKELYRIISMLETLAYQQRMKDDEEALLLLIA